MCTLLYQIVSWSPGGFGTGMERASHRTFGARSCAFTTRGSGEATNGWSSVCRFTRTQCVSEYTELERDIQVVCGVKVRMQHPWAHQRWDENTGGRLVVFARAEGVTLMTCSEWAQSVDMHMQ